MQLFLDGRVYFRCKEKSLPSLAVPNYQYVLNIWDEESSFTAGVKIFVQFRIANVK